MLSVDEKEDLFEFTFIDLCIELGDEWETDGRIRKMIEKYIGYKKRLMKKKKGLRINHEVVKDYLKRFIIFIKSKPGILNGVLK
jgi:hypothetical protein